MCTDGTIVSRSLISVGTGTLDCVGGGYCRVFNSTTTDVICTDYSSRIDYSTGERMDIQILSINRTFVVGFSDGNCIVLDINGNGPWQATA